MHPNYSITKKGEVYNIKKNKLMKIHISYNGYKYVSTSGGTYYIHRLLALKYIPNPLNLREVNHIDGNKLNNELSNLEWCTSSYNTKHAYKLGLQSQKGEKNNASKLTKTNIMEIKKLKLKGLKQKEIADIFAVNQSTVNRVINLKIWNHAS